MLLREPVQAQRIVANTKKTGYRGRSQHPKVDPETIEFRYDREKKIIDAISKGEKERVFKLLESSGEVVDLSTRIPENPVRSLKNITLVFTTLCRYAAERGGVHPIYIHQLSERFALLIERASSLQELTSIRRAMIIEYCDAVRDFSTRRFHPIVKKAVQYIQFNLEAELTLQGIAAKIGTNASYLSRVFKENTGVGIIDYIHAKRVDEAKLHLRNDHATITDIAFLVGFTDVNYFGRVFQKLTGQTPSAYKRSMM